MRYLSLIPLIIWIAIFPIIGGVASYYSGIDGLWLLAIISFIAIFNLVWFWISSSRNDEMGNINVICNLIILNIPAYILIKKYFKTKQSKDRQSDINKIYKKKDSVDYKQKTEEFDFDLADWEKELLKQKNIKKYNKYVRETEKDDLKNWEVSKLRKIIRGFSVYVMYNIYKAHPDILNTYNIIQEFKKDVETKELLDKLIVKFSNNKNISEFIEDYNAKEMTKNVISDSLKETNPQEFIVAFNQDRVDIMIDAKNILAETK